MRNENVTPTGEHKQGRVYVLDPQGTLRNSFVPANQFLPAPGNGGCSGAGWDQTAVGLRTVNVSPDGTKLAYAPQANVFQRLSSHPWCRMTELGKTFISNLDGTGATQLVASDGKSDFQYPSWVGNSRVIMRFGVVPNESAVYSYTVGGAVALWYTKAAFIDSLASNEPAMRSTKLADVNYDVLQVWATNGGPPALPTQACRVQGAHGPGGVGQFGRPTWSPDAAIVAWTEKVDVADAPDEGISVSPVGDITSPGNCPSHDTSQLVIQGGTEPFWGPAANGNGGSANRRLFDFDGDAKADVGIFRPSVGTWFVQKSTGGDSALGYGTNGDIPVTADYDGDGKADHGVFRPSMGAWFIKRSTGGDTVVGWGTSRDVPTPLHPKASGSRLRRERGWSRHPEGRT
ncbi:MAG: VCBS repeat-containing protein [Actinomycetota bacterium]|nr:VCBS repeat-containing protein [Actinomycetota bacterium]